MNSRILMLAVGLLGFGCSGDSSQSVDMGIRDAHIDGGPPDCPKWDGDREACELAGCRAEGRGQYCMIEETCQYDPTPRIYCVWTGELEGLLVGGGYFHRSDGTVTEFSQVYPKGALEDWGSCWGSWAPDEWEEGAPEACGCLDMDIAEGICP